MQIKFIGRLMGDCNVAEAVKHAAASGDVVLALVPDRARLISKSEPDQFGADFFLALVESEVPQPFIDHGNFKELATFA